MPWQWDAGLRRALVLCVGVAVFATSGYTLIEGWGPWRSFFFALTTLTTVGYGDEGISETGERFTAVVMIGGIATMSYCLTQIIDFITTRAMHPERKIMQQIRRLSGHHIVCGVGSMGVRVIERLEGQGEVVVAIERDPGVVERLRAKGLIALQGDATGDAVLQDAGVSRARSLAAVTGCDAVNAMICLSARAIAPDLSIVARAHDTDSETKLRRAGAQSVISPTIYGGDGIAEFMARPDAARIMFGSSGTDTAVSNPMRIMELVIDEDDPAVGQPISVFADRHPTLAVVAFRAQHGAFEMKPDSARVLRDGDSLMVAGLVADLGSLRIEPAAA